MFTVGKHVNTFVIKYAFNICKSSIFIKFCISEESLKSQFFEKCNSLVVVLVLITKDLIYTNNIVLYFSPYGKKLSCNC